MAEQQEFTGNAAQDPRRLTGEVEGLTVWDRYPRGRNHPNQPEAENGDFKEWMVTSPNSMVAEGAFAVGATISDTVTPANPTPPTNIQYWGETPPNSEEMKAAAAPDEPFVYSSQKAALEAEPEETREQLEARSVSTYCLHAGDPEDQTKFAPNQGGMAHEAAGTEDVQTMSYDASGEATPVEVPIAVSAGVVGYTQEPNVTHPSNPDAVEPPPIEPPPEPIARGSEEYDDEEDEEDDEANTIEEGGEDKPRTRRKKKGRRK